jgi:hypothetical protein
VVAVPPSSLLLTASLSLCPPSLLRLLREDFGRSRALRCRPRPGVSRPVILPEASGSSEIPSGGGFREPELLGGRRPPLGDISLVVLIFRDGSASPFRL